MPRKKRKKKHTLIEPLKEAYHDILSLRQASRRLGLSYGYALELVNSGVLPRRDLETQGERTYIWLHQRDVDAYLSWKEIPKERRPEAPEYPEEDALPLFFTLTDAADYMELSTIRIRQLRAEGRLKGKRIGPNRIFLAEELDSYVPYPHGRPRKTDGWEDEYLIVLSHPETGKKAGYGVRNPEVDTLYRSPRYPDDYTEEDDYKHLKRMRYFARKWYGTENGMKPKERGAPTKGSKYVGLPPGFFRSNLESDTDTNTPDTGPPQK